MTSTKRSMIVTVCCVALIGTGAVGAQDWPQWLGSNRDAKVTGFEAPQTWPEAMTQKWKIAVGAGDTSGIVLWRNDEYTSVPRFFTSMSPIVVDGMCIAHLGGSDDGAIIAFDLASGDDNLNPVDRKGEPT